MSETEKSDEVTVTTAFAVLFTKIGMTQEIPDSDICCGILGECPTNESWRFGIGERPFLRAILDQWV